MVSDKRRVKLFNKTLQSFLNDYCKLFKEDSTVIVKKISEVSQFYKDIKDHYKQLTDCDDSLFIHVDLLKKMNLHNRIFTMSAEDKLKVFQHIHNLYIVSMDDTEENITSVMKELTESLDTADITDSSITDSSIADSSSNPQQPDSSGLPDLSGLLGSAGLPGSQADGSMPDISNMLNMILSNPQFKNIVNDITGSMGNKSKSGNSGGFDIGSLLSSITSPGNSSDNADPNSISGMINSLAKDISHEITSKNKSTQESRVTTLPDTISDPDSDTLPDSDESIC